MSARSNSTVELLQNHVTIRSFKPDPVPQEILDQILKGARRSPTSSNMQAYSMIVVQNPEVKQKLAEFAGNQKHVETCPVFIAFCADLHRLEQTCQLHDVKMSNNLETFLIASIDASLVGMSTQTAVESFGLGAVMIGAMRNHPEKVAELLELPPNVYVVYGMCIGWPIEGDIPPQKPRLPADLVIHQETYDQSDPHLKIQAYDRELAEHYTTLGRNAHPAAWSGVIAKNLSKPLRSTFKATLEGMGFNL